MKIGVLTRVSANGRRRNSIDNQQCRTQAFSPRQSPPVTLRAGMETKELLLAQLREEFPGTLATVFDN